MRLLSVRNESAREFYETEALRGGWSVRQIDRQIGSQFYERTALSKNRASMLTGGLMERENPPVGLILCSEKDEALARYALEGLPNNVMAAEYRITLPDETVLAAELDRTRQAMEDGGDAL